jgi:hypothetical protein
VRLDLKLKRGKRDSQSALLTFRRALIVKNVGVYSWFSIFLPYNPLTAFPCLVQKIKADLIHKAKVRKSYAKLKARELSVRPLRSSYPTKYLEAEEDRNDGKDVQAEPASLDLHPDRQAMLDSHPAETNTSRLQRDGADRQPRRGRRPKPSPFIGEVKIAEKRKEELEAKQKLREIREKDRQAMIKARRPDQFGKRRLGRQSKVLLDRVKRMVGADIP